MAKVLSGYFKDCDAQFRDAALPTSVAPSGGRGPTNRKLIASFPGTSFVAEREEGELRIYLVSDVALPTNLTGDAACGCDAGGRVDAKKMQLLVERSRKRAGER